MRDCGDRYSRKGQISLKEEQCKQIQIEINDFSRKIRSLWESIEMNTMPLTIKSEWDCLIQNVEVSLLQLLNNSSD